MGRFMSEKDIAHSVLKAVSILKAFEPGELELSIAQISKKVGIPKTTARRMIVTLASTGLLEQSNRTGMFKIGPALYMQGNLYLQASDFLTEIRLVAGTLGELTGETITASVFDKDKFSITYVLVQDSIYPLRWDIQVGKTIPAHVTATGRAFLSELDDTEIDELFPGERLPAVTKNSITDKAELKKELAEIRQTGVAFDMERFSEGLEGAASLVRDASGKTVVGMVIAALSLRMNEFKRVKHAELIKLGAGLASYRLGYNDPSLKVHDLEELRAWWQQNGAVPAALASNSFPVA